MAQINVKLSDERLSALRRYTQRHRTPVSWLIRDYVEYLLAWSSPVLPDLTEGPSPTELATFAQHGGQFDWLTDEPDLYSLDDGEPL